MDNKRTCIGQSERLLDAFRTKSISPADQYSKTASPQCLVEETKKSAQEEKEIEEIKEVQIQHDEGGDDVSVNVAIEGEEEVF